MSWQGILFVEHQGEIVGGGQFSLLALMQHLRNYQPHCATGGTGTMTAAVRALDIDVEVISMPPIRPGRIFAVWRCVWDIYRMARKRDVVLLHANGSRCMFYAGLAAKFLRLPVCWHVRINDSDGWWDRLLAGWATCIVVVSPAVAQRFAHLDVGAKVRIIYNGVDLEVFAHGDRAVSRARWGWGDRPVVGMVAQLIPLKRHDIFIAAAALLAPRFPEAVFAIVGSEPDPAQGYEALLRSQVAELGLEERVVFTGFCDDAPGLFAAFDIAVLTSESVIIVTRDRHEAAEAAVRSVLQVDYPAEKLEVVVIEETDQPRPIEGDRVRYVAIPWRNLGLGFARNQGVKHSQGEVFAFTDDDCLIHRDWLRELVGPLLTEEGTAAIAGAVLVPVCGPVGQCENILGFPGGGVKFIEEAQGEIVRRATFSTCNCAVYRWAVEEVGGFREFNKSSGEDELLSRQISARHPLLYTPHAIVWHEPRDSFGKVYGWLVRRGHSRVEMAQNVTDKGALYRRMALQSPLVRLAMANMAGMAVGLPLWFSSLVLVVLYYFSVLYRYRWSRNYHPSWKTFLLLPWVKATMDLAMDIGTIGKLFARGKTEG